MYSGNFWLNIIVFDFRQLGTVYAWIVLIMMTRASMIFKQTGDFENKGFR